MGTESPGDKPQRASLCDRWQDEYTWTTAEGGKRTPRQTAADASFHEVEEDEQ
ncbi:hypothetical protein [Microbacterium xylanilyticum]